MTYCKGDNGCKLTCNCKRYEKELAEGKKVFDVTPNKEDKKCNFFVFIKSKE